MPGKMTQAERIARLEAVTDERHRELMALLERNNPAPLVDKAIDRIDGLDKKWTVRFDGLEASHREDVAALALLENRGKGVAITLAAIFAGIGAASAGFWAKLAEIFS